MLTELKAEGDRFLAVTDHGERPAKLCSDIHSAGDICKSVALTLIMSTFATKEVGIGLAMRNWFDSSKDVRTRNSEENAFTGKILP